LGPNGSGKTFLAESIAACLYGKFPSRFGSLYDFMSADQSVIQGSFTISGRNLLITRRVSKVKKTKESEVSISDIDTGEILTSSKSSEATNLISTILMPYKTFIASVFSSQRTEFDLCEERPESRRDLLASIADLDKQQMASDLAAVRVAKLDEEIKEQEKLKEYLSRKIISANVSQLNEELLLLQSDLSDANAVDSLRESKQKKLRSDLSKFTKLQEQYERFVKFSEIEKSLSSKPMVMAKQLADLYNLLESTKYNDAIPCLAVSKDLIKQCPLAVDYLKQERISKEIKRLEKFVDKKTIAEFKSLTSMSQRLGKVNECKNYEDKISLIEKELDDLSGFRSVKRDDIIKRIASIEATIKEVSKSTAELHAIEPKLIELNESKRLFTMLVEAWGKHGAQAHIIHEMISIVAGYANNVLSMLDMPMSVSIETLKPLSTGGKKETIAIMASHMGKVIEYRNLSGGESRAFQLAIRYGLCKYMMSLGIDAGMLVLDETFDKLDDQKSDMMMKLIKHISEEDGFDQVIFISHTMRDLALADGVIKLRQDGGAVSTIRFERC